MIHGAQEFCRQPRRDEGAYPQRSVTEEQRWMAVKGQADCVMIFLDGSLGLKIPSWELGVKPGFSRMDRKRRVSGWANSFSKMRNGIGEGMEALDDSAMLRGSIRSSHTTADKWLPCQSRTHSLLYRERPSSGIQRCRPDPAHGHR